MIYLNNAATSYPKPPEVVKAVTDYLSSIPFHSSRTGFELQKEDVICSCRQKLAKLFNIKDPRNIIFTSGATESLNLAIYGLDLEGKHVITTATEHNSVLRPLKTLERDGVIELSIVDCDSRGFVDPDDIRKAIYPKTKAIVINHCSNVTGTVVDIKAIASIAHDREIVIIVDAAQSAGAIPIDVIDWDVDIMAFAGHKSLYGMPGVGGIYIREELRLKPLKIGGTGVRSDLLYQPEEIPMYYEAGTPNLPGIISLNAGVDWILKTGLAQIAEKKRSLLRKIIELLQKLPDLVLYGDPKKDEGGCVICFNIDGMPPSDVGYLLENSFGIIARSGLHCAPLIHKALGSYSEGSIRLSPSYFTTDQQVEALFEAVGEMCKAKVAI